MAKIIAICRKIYLDDIQYIMDCVKKILKNFAVRKFDSV